MSTGIVRRIDDLGRVVIPAEMRRTLGINEGDELEISLEGDHVEIRPRFPTLIREFSVKSTTKVALPGTSLELEPGEYMVQKIVRKR